MSEMLNEYKFNDPKEAVMTVYNIMMNLAERYCRGFETDTLTDKIIAEMREEFRKADDIMKVNMLQIPFFTFSSMMNYMTNDVKPALSENWQEVLQNDFEEFQRKLNKKGLKKIFEKKDPLVKESKKKKGRRVKAVCSDKDLYCEELLDYHYYVMSNACRCLYNTDLFHDSILEKLRSALFGSRD